MEVMKYYSEICLRALKVHWSAYFLHLFFHEVVIEKASLWKGKHKEMFLKGNHKSISENPFNERTN